METSRENIRKFSWKILLFFTTRNYYKVNFIEEQIHSNTFHSMALKIFTAILKRSKIPASGACLDTFLGRNPPKIQNPPGVIFGRSKWPPGGMLYLGGYICGGLLSPSTMVLCDPTPGSAPIPSELVMIPNHRYYSAVRISS